MGDAVMKRYHALTWDHPRGYNALAAAADKARAEGLVDIIWDKQPLEGFESHPIADLCARYDLVVLDHPHVGEAVAENCLRPLEEVFGADALTGIGKETIGPCLESYHYQGATWALPLDAATQVMALRPDLVEDVPRTWKQVVDLSWSGGTVALSLAGPHAILTFLSIAAAYGEEAGRKGHQLVTEETGLIVYDLMNLLASRSPASVRDLNPIGILGHMAAHDDVALCPLIYGYVNYAAPTSDQAIRFRDAPVTGISGRPGSTLGGTGIAISRRCEVTPELIEHLRWLMSEEAQTRFIPGHDGQPSRRSAWSDQAVNGRWGQFYRNTAATLESAYVRPRFNGYIRFQTEASALLRDSFSNKTNAKTAIAALNALFAKHAPEKDYAP
jgi:multiple sugar transport system substrate-binding protein